MNNTTLLVTCDDDNVIEHSGEENNFALQNTRVFFDNADSLHLDNELERLVFLITKKPKCLVNHMQRISFCFSEIHSTNSYSLQLLIL